MVKKMISWAGALCALVSTAYAASATVWTEGEGGGTKAPAYWYPFKYGTGSSVDSTAWSETSRLTILKAKEGKTSNGAGFGFTWEQNASYKDVAVTLAAYKGVCLTYSATAPFRIDFKQSTITDDNYYGAELSAGAKKTFVAFADLKQGWKSTTAVSWNVTKQMGVQFSFKNTHATAAVNSNMIEITNFELADECVTFAPTLLPPYTAEDEGVLNEGDTLKLNLAEVFTDPDGDIASYTVKIVGDEVGLVKLADSLYNTTGVVKLITKENPKGDAVVTITATDATKKSASYALSIATVDGENAPVAVDDAYTTEEEKPLKVTLLKNGVVANDYDPDGDSFTPVIVSEPAHGTLVFDDEGGLFTYTPEANFFGKDVFTYRLVEDPRVGDDTYEVLTGNVATVTITVTNVDDPIMVTVTDSAFTVGEEEYKLGDTLVLDEDFNPIMVKIPQASVVFSDPDVAATNLEVNAKASGILTVDLGELKSNYALQLLPIADANGVAKVSLFAVDGKDTASVWFFVKVNPVADLPVAVDDKYEVKEDIEFSVKAAKGVLANDYNPDDRKVTLTAVLVTEPEHGVLTLAKDGSFTYMPEQDYVGDDSFTYYVVNATEEKSEVATVTLTVIDMPEPPILVVNPATLDTVIREDNGSVTYSEKVYSTWAKAYDGKSKLYYTFTSDDGKIKTQNNKGAWWVMAERNAFGDAYVTVSVTDSISAPLTFKIHIYITPVNDSPVVAKRDTLRVKNSGWKETVDLDSLFFDADGDTLTYKVIAPKVLATEIADGALIITPATDSTVLNDGVYRVKVQAKDATDSTTATIVVLVGEAAQSISPVVAAPKATWQSAVQASRGSVAMFDMQGRVMWKAKLPVSEAQVRAAAAQVQGRKILQVNKQTWTIK